MNSQRLHGEFSSPHPSKNGTRLILSVDDEPGILVSRQLILEGGGYEVLSAADGEQAPWTCSQPSRWTPCCWTMSCRE